MSETWAVEFKNISKSFGACCANEDISFSVRPGQIHAIVGENGAGKSTAMKILFGFYPPDQGSVRVFGQPLSFQSPLDAMANGIGMVHQHFMLAEPLTALDNILLQENGPFWQRLPRKKRHDELLKLAERYGFQINLSSKIENLSVGEQQRLEILKVLSQNSRILILDEPTAVLTPQEVQELFKNLRLLRDEGRTILIITHKLKEVMALADEVTVFRAGKSLVTKKVNDTSIEELAELMIGRRLVEPSARSTAIDFHLPLLEVENLQVNENGHRLQIGNLKVHSREIVGVAGVEGNGQDLLIRSLIDPASVAIEESTQITVRGQWGVFPEDRLRYGVLAKRPLFENFLMGQLRRFSAGPFLRLQELRSATRDALDKYDIRPRDENVALKTLSGGNQQKLVVARALSQDPSVILAAQPTRGVDIGAIEFIHNQIRQKRDEGAGVLLISSELDELMALSDRIVVIYKGQLIAELGRQDFDEIALGTAMGGGQ